MPAAPDPHAVPEPAPAPEGGAPVPAPDTQPAPEAPAGAPAPAAEPASAEETFEQLIELEQLTPAQAKKLRSEAKNLRERYTPFRDTFDGWDPEDVEGLLWLAQQYRLDPAAAAEHFLTVGKQLAEEFGNQGAPAPEEDPDRPMTVAEFRKWQEEQEQLSAHQSEQQIVSQLEAKANELGYKAGTPEYVSLMYLATLDEKQGGSDGDLDKAHKILEARKQAIIDEYVEGRRRDAQQGLGKPSPGSPAVPAEREIKTDDQAKAALWARLRGMAGQASD